MFFFSSFSGYKLAFNYLKAKRHVDAIDVCHKVRHHWLFVQLCCVFCLYRSEYFFFPFCCFEVYIDYD